MASEHPNLGTCSTPAHNPAPAPAPAPPQASLARLAALDVIRSLRARGFQALLAGGCVRDELLGRLPSDYDVVTDATPAMITKAFAHTSEVGAHFGVVLVRADVPGAIPARQTIEVATFRADGAYSDHRRPDGVRFSDPGEDAQRRDFTVNALFLDPLAPAPLPPHARARCIDTPQGLVVDYVGGLQDLEARVLRAVGDPDARLAEDHLRALRAVRLSAKLGFAIEPATAQAITRHASDLRGVSKERIGDEVRAMLEHPARGHAMQVLAELGLLAQVFEGALSGPAASHDASSRRFAHLRALPEASIREGGDPASIQDGMSTCAGGVGVCLAAILLDLHPDVLDEPPDVLNSLVDAVRRSLCLSNLETARLACALRSLRLLVPETARGSWWQGAGRALRKRLASAYGFADALALLRTRPEWNSLDEQVRRDVGELAGDGVGLAPVPVLTGDQLVTWGFKPGKQFKPMLDQAYDAQLDGRIRDLQQARELVERLRVGPQEV